MKTRYFIISFFLIVLIFLLVSEQIFVNSTIDFMEQNALALKQDILSQESINNEKITQKIDFLEQKWTQKEKILCLIANHKDVENIGEQIAKLKITISQNQKQQTEQELELLIFYIQNYDHYVAISWQNLF